MDYKVITGCFNNAQGHSGRDCDFYLEEDEWNDYSYHTMYHLHATRRLTGKEQNEYLGYIRIMRLGQKTGEANVVRSATGGRVFHKLPDDFVSLSFNVSMFQRLRGILSAEQRVEMVNALRMIVSPGSALLEKAHGDDCFIMSLLRDGASLEGFHMSQIESYMLGTAALYDLRREVISVQFSHVVNPVDLKFVCRDDDDKDYSRLGLPDGVVVFVGKNGSGKSTAMYKLARLIHSDPTMRFNLKEGIGEILPTDIGVIKLLIFSYSPFDNFYIPGMDDIQLLSQLKNWSFEDCPVLFSGIRDVSKEMEMRAERTDDTSFNDRVDSICLKPNETLCSEFLLALNYIMTLAGNRELLWNGFLNSCQSGQRNLYQDIIRVLEAPEKTQQAEFANTATGHKFIMHSIARLIAYIEDNSLVLFDEPENHLHPPLLSFYYERVRKVIDQFRSVAFISTHSPVIVQETFAKNVHIVRRLDGKTVIAHPQIETYGASISSISSEVFDLTTDVMNTYKVFSKIFANELMEFEETPEAMLEEFKRVVGGELSGPMESFLLNLYFAKHSSDVDS